MPHRLLGLVAAVEAGVAVWCFTNGRWINGLVYTIGVAILGGVYVRAERKPKAQDGRRRY